MNLNRLAKVWALTSSPNVGEAAAAPRMAAALAYV